MMKKWISLFLILSVSACTQTSLQDINTAEEYVEYIVKADPPYQNNIFYMKKNPKTNIGGVMVSLENGIHFPWLIVVEPNRPPRLLTYNGDKFFVFDVHLTSEKLVLTHPFNDSDKMIFYR